MKILRGISHIKRYREPVLAIGVFDGVHTGHAAIIRKCVLTAKKNGGTSIVLTFWPHPQKEQSIYSLDHRLSILAAMGVQVCVVVRFNGVFASMRAEDFISRIIAGKIGATRVMVGANFRFGKRLKGDAAMLCRYARTCGYRPEIFPLRKIGGRPVSSTVIRESISSGHLQYARRMLGRRVSILGTVIRGRAVGRTLGYPTANIRPQHDLLPPDGIYAVLAFVGGHRIPGICYKGTRSTFIRSRVSVIEVHLFNFAGDLYGKRMELRFFRKIRADRKFDSSAALAAAIRKDIAAAKNILSRPE